MTRARVGLLFLYFRVAILGSMIQVDSFLSRFPEEKLEDLNVGEEKKAQNGSYIRRFAAAEISGVSCS